MTGTNGDFSRDMIPEQWKGPFPPGQATHKSRLMTCPFTGKDVPIDEGIADIVDLLWKNGIRTTMSCENLRGTGLMWFSFPEEDAKKLMSILFTNGQGLVFQRYLGLVYKDGKYVAEDCWHWELTTSFDQKGIGDMLGSPEPPEFTFDYILRIPVRDHQVVVNELKLRLKEKGQQT